MKVPPGRVARGQAASSRPIPARLVFLLQDLQFGGTQRQTLELARLLDPSHFQVEVWLLAGGDDLAPLARDHGIPLVWLSREAQVHAKSLFRLWWRLRSKTPDLLMALTVIPNIWGRLLGRLARVPVIVGNCRGGEAPRRQHEGWLWPLTNQILCNSQATKTSLTNGYRVPEPRITVIPNGVDTDFFHPPPARSGGEVVLSVARMVPEKDHETLIRAFRLVASARPEAELWLVGEGPLLSAVRQLTGSFLSSRRVKFLPPRADLRSLFQQASVLVLSSRAEALPNVILEGMATGLPVVATRIGGLPELVVPDQTGFLVPPEDPPALAAALTRLLGEPETREYFGRAGRERVVKDFSLPAMAGRHEEVWHRLLAQAGY